MSRMRNPAVGLLPGAVVQRRRPKAKARRMAVVGAAAAYLPSVAAAAVLARAVAAAKRAATSGNKAIRGREITTRKAGMAALTASKEIVAALAKLRTPTATKVSGGYVDDISDYSYSDDGGDTYGYDSVDQWNAFFDEADGGSLAPIPVPQQDQQQQQADSDPYHLLALSILADKAAAAAAEADRQLWIEILATTGASSTRV